MRNFVDVTDFSGFILTKQLPRIISTPPIVEVNLLNFVCRSSLYTHGDKTLPHTAGINLSQKIGTFCLGRGREREILLVQIFCAKKFSATYFSV